MKPIDRLEHQLFGDERTVGKVKDVKFFLADKFTSLDDFCEDAIAVFQAIDSGSAHRFDRFPETRQAVSLECYLRA
jgi:hypothetical protein